MTPPTSFTCPGCGRTSHHPADVSHSYCGACLTFWKQLGPGAWSNELGEMHVDLGQMLIGHGYADTPRNRGMLEQTSRNLAEQLGMEIIFE